MSTRAIVTINGPAEREQIARWAHKVEAGTIVEFRKKTRSHEQSAKMWAMLHEVSDQVEWYGTKLDAEDWKDVFTASLRHARVVPGIDKGTFVPLGMRTSSMTIEEMTNLIELIYAFGAEQNVVFKEPRESNDNTNPGEDTPGPPETDDPPPSVREGDGTTPQPSPSNPLPAELRQHLMDFARKASKTVDDKELTAEAKDKAVSDMMLNYRDVVPEADWPKLSTVVVCLKAVLNGKRTLEQSRKFIAGDLLDCDVAEIGGAA